MSTIIKAIKNFFVDFLAKKGEVELSPTQYRNHNLTYLCVDVGEGVEVGTYEITEEDRQKMFDTFREILAKYKFNWNTL